MSHAAYRAAAVAFLTDYAATATGLSKKMQVYRARPLTINPPTGFVDEIREAFVSTGITLHQRRPQVDVVVLFGTFDSGEAVDQKDAFVDGLADWIMARPAQAGANTLIDIVSCQDLPAFVNDWMPKEAQRSYFGTLITLEGFSEN